MAKDKANKVKEAMEAHKKAMDDVVSVNGIFSFAVFVGLTFSANESLVSKPECKLKDTNGTAKRLLLLEIVSFSCFLLSSLTAKGLKNCLSAYTMVDNNWKDFNSGWSRGFRGVLIALSVSATTAGCIFLSMSMIDVVRIRLGKVTCEAEALKAAAAVIGIVSFALAVYFPASMFEVMTSMKNIENLLQNEQIDKEQTH